MMPLQKSLRTPKKKRNKFDYYEINMLRTIGPDGEIDISLKNRNHCYSARAYIRVPNNYPKKKITDLFTSVSGGCVGTTAVGYLKEKIGQWCIFEIGDPARFRGMIIGFRTASFGGTRMKIKLSEKDELYLYFWIGWDRIAYPIEIVP